MAKRTKAAHRRLAAWILADLVRLAAVQRAAGKKLAAGAWLAVGANILSSAPPGRESGACGAPERFGLTYEHLFIFAERCRLNASADDIHRQVAATLAWRAAESARIGRPHHLPMSPDTIGKLLGVTEDERSAAGARNIGTACGSREAREAAARERNREREAQRRRKAGAVSREEYEAAALSRSRPWDQEGVSRRTWERRRRRAEKQSETAVASPCVASPCVTNKGAVASPCVTNIDDCQNASSASGLEADCSISDARGDISALPAPAADAEELAERLRRMRSEPAPPRPPLPPGGLAARALATIRKPQGAGALGRARPGVGKIAAE